MRWRIPLVVVLALFAAVSCDQQLVEPPQETAVTSPTFDFSNGPAEPGASIVVRSEFDDFFWRFDDSETGLIVIATADDFECVDFDELTPVPVQELFQDPPDTGLQMYFEGGWLNAAVFDGEECSDLLAVGKIHNQWTDNDVYAWLYESGRSNAYGGSANGKIGDYQISWKLRCVWGGMTKDDHHNHCKESVHIK